MLELQDKINRTAEEKLTRDLQEWHFVLKNLTALDIFDSVTKFGNPQNQAKNIRIIQPNASDDNGYHFMACLREVVRERLLPDYIKVEVEEFYKLVQTIKQPAP